VLALASGVAVDGAEHADLAVPLLPPERDQWFTLRGQCQRRTIVRRREQAAQQLRRNWPTARFDGCDMRLARADGLGEGALSQSGVLACCAKDARGVGQRAGHVLTIPALVYPWPASQDRPRLSAPAVGRRTPLWARRPHGPGSAPPPARRPGPARCAGRSRPRWASRRCG